MKITHSPTIQSLLLAAVLGSGLGFVSPVSAQQVRSYIVDSNGTGLAELGTFGGGESLAYDINDAGQVVWYSRVAGMRAGHAFITGPNGVGMTDLGTLGGTESSAYGINDTGQVVGGAWITANTYHAFITGPNGAGMSDLGTLGGDSSFASGINDAGRVVGWSYRAAGDQHAFITGPNGIGMTDLNSLVSLPGGGVLTEATGINNHGQVAAIGNPIPEPETYAMLLAGLGLLGFIARGRKTA
jgi:probable HAF family extracellular repeat protein